MWYTTVQANGCKVNKRLSVYVCMYVQLVQLTASLCVSHPSLLWTSRGLNLRLMMIAMRCTLHRRRLTVSTTSGSVLPLISHHLCCLASRLHLLSYVTEWMNRVIYRPGRCPEILKFVLKCPEIGVRSWNSYIFPEIFHAFSQFFFKHIILLILLMSK